MQDHKLLKLPKLLDTHPQKAAVEAVLVKDLRPLWEGGRIPVAHLELTAALEKALITSRVAHQLERGLEQIEKVLENEERGLAPLRESQPSSGRVSRILLIADEGTERFYRSCESLVYKHQTRVLGVRVLATPARLAEKLYGPDKFVKALLVTDKDAAAQVLLALSEPANSK